MLVFNTTINSCWTNKCDGATFEIEPSGECTHWLDRAATTSIDKTQESRGQTEVARSSKEDTMCPACIGNAAIVIAGAASSGGIVAVCIGKFRKLFRASGLSLFNKTKEE